jgi:hypothetical protein
MQDLPSLLPPAQGSVRPSHSVRSAATGSRLAALRAGSQLASSAAGRERQRCAKSSAVVDVSGRHRLAACGAQLGTSGGSMSEHIFWFNFTRSMAYLKSWLRRPRLPI